MGAGRKHEGDGNYLTCRRTLRTVAVADGDVDDVAEILDTRVDLGDDRKGNRGHETTIAVFALLDGPTAATIQLWGLGSEEEFEDSSSSSIGGSGGEWCMYDSQNITVNTMLVYANMPAGLYKVVVSAITGAGDVVIREAHSG